MFDIIVQSEGNLIGLTALVSSPIACHLLATMQWGTVVNGTRYISEAECDAAFDLIDHHHLTTRTLG